MGNELTKNNESDIEKDFQNENIKYGLISKICGEKSNDDNYIISPDITIPTEEKTIEFSIFGIFDGHNGNYISKYLSENIKKFFEKAMVDINDKNYKEKIEELYKEIDKSLRNEKNQILDKSDIKNKNIVDIEVNDKEKEYLKNSIINSNDIPSDLKDIDDNEIENLLLFKNLFDYKSNFLHKENGLNYIGSSASIVLIDEENIIKIDLGITKCFLFDKEGNILEPQKKEENQKDTKEIDNNEYKNEHIFINKEEKKRIKKFNNDIDYESLKKNYYLPTTRSFGFYKYKENEFLNEYYQIISCIPNIEIYDKKNVDFIFLITGLSISSNRLKILSEKIKKENTDNNNEIKYTKLIEEIIKEFKKEKISNEQSNKQKVRNNYNLYFGKDNVEEENIILDELDENYYKDILELNKTREIQEKNTTCILIKLNKKETDNKDKNEIKEETPKDNEETPKGNDDTQKDKEETPKGKEDTLKDKEETQKDKEETPKGNEDTPKENEDKPKEMKIILKVK